MECIKYVYLSSFLLWLQIDMKGLSFLRVIMEGLEAMFFKVFFTKPYAFPCY